MIKLNWVSKKVKNKIPKRNIFLKSFFYIIWLRSEDPPNIIVVHFLFVLIAF